MYYTVYVLFLDVYFVVIVVGYISTPLSPQVIAGQTDQVPAFSVSLHWDHQRPIYTGVTLK